MLEELKSGVDIARETDRLLKKASAYGRFPTPVGDIVAAAKLTESKSDLFDKAVLHTLPSKLRRVIVRLESKVHAALDRDEKIIYLNQQETTQGARTFKKLHETTHEILPWQRELAYADDALTLSTSTTALFEREANQGAAELLFQRELFGSLAADYEVGFAPIVTLSQKFGSSIHSAFRRFVETGKVDMCGIVMKPQKAGAYDTVQRREAFASQSWLTGFPDPRKWPIDLKIKEWPFMTSVLMAQVNPSVVHPSQCALANLNGDTQTLNVEAFFNSYCLFVLLWRPQVRRRSIFRRRRAVVVSR